jgi:hypothetical protein
MLPPLVTYVKTEIATKNVAKIIIAPTHSVGAVCLIMVMSSERGIMTSL